MEVSEYEAKRLRRIEENRKKLQSLNIPVIEVASSPQSQSRKRKRDAEELALEPTRKSKRQHKQQKLKLQQRRAEKQQHQVDREERTNEEKLEHKRRAKLERKELRWLKKQKKLEKKLKKQIYATINHQNTQSSEQLNQQEIDQQQEQAVEVLERLKRKMDALEEKREASLRRREKRKFMREKEKQIKLMLEMRDREMQKKIEKKEKLQKAVEKELAFQRRSEDRKMMRAEDRLAKQWAKQQAREARMKLLHEKRRLMGKPVADKLICTEENQAQQEGDDAYAEMRSTRQIRLPFVRISDDNKKNQTKPLVLTPLLKIDPIKFHVFSLGKQFLPVGKKSVMQGLCPGRFTADFRDDVNIYEWKNAMTLFVNGTNGMFYHYLFEESTLNGRKHVFFRWTRWGDLTPPILSRLTQVQKGEELLGTENYHTPTGKPDPLLLFVQYPNGPYIYCGRLGYLGYRSDPLEFSFQLLDINALNWAQIRTEITLDDKKT